MCHFSSGLMCKAGPVLFYAHFANFDMGICFTCPRHPFSIGTFVWKGFQILTHVTHFCALCAMQALCLLLAFQFRHIFLDCKLYDILCRSIGIVLPGKNDTFYNYEWYDIQYQTDCLFVLPRWTDWGIQHENSGMKRNEILLTHLLSILFHFQYFYTLLTVWTTENEITF